ncbi:hypothetical protein RRG08_011937 [Elysia crispata]|uniref:Uncharacterized protein n=1 Tax=Elysia crispata TaxID=231223 RepID=A0AAE0Z2E7_9GAST|nr:hypothetical protein RRG08_011937 [Elysia crispata]
MRDHTFLNLTWKRTHLQKTYTHSRESVSSYLYYRCDQPRNLQHSSDIYFETAPILKSKVVSYLSFV